MAGIRIEFAQFGDFDSFSVYRSNSPMDPSELPSAMITGLKTMYAEDATVAEGGTYYYRVAVVRGDEVIVSDEVKVVATTRYKWWRISNIRNRFNAQPTYGVSIGRILFDTEEGVISNEPARGFSSNSYNDLPDYNGQKAFDGTPETLVASKSVPYTTNIVWHIGYEFESPVKVVSVQLQTRADINPTMGHEWQTADIEVSLNGVAWFKYGVIEPRVAEMNTSLIGTPIIQE